MHNAQRMLEQALKSAQEVHDYFQRNPEFDDTPVSHSVQNIGLLLSTMRDDLEKLVVKAEAMEGVSKLRKIEIHRLSLDKARAQREAASARATHEALMLDIAKWESITGNDFTAMIRGKNV